MVISAHDAGRDGDATRRAGGWDRAAFERAYRDHGEAVYAVARVLCAADVAEDVTYQVFLDLWHHPERNDQAGASLRRPLLAAALALSRSAPCPETTSFGPRPLTTAGPRAGPDRAGHLTGPDAERVLAARPLDLLPREEREAIVAVHHRGLTCAEAGVALGLDEATVKVQLRQGLRRLGRALGRPASPVGREGDADLDVALDRRDVVAQAQGIVMERRGGTAGDAERELVRSAAQLGISLHALAEAVVATGRDVTVDPGS